jgi:uncharacterized protein YwqG
MMNFEDKLSQAVFERVANDLKRGMLEATRLITERADESVLELGTTKIGGKPDLPVGTSWPTWNGSDLSFIAQINLADFRKASQTLLPEKGLLSFFYDSEQTTWGFDPKDSGSWRVMYFSDLSSLERFELPASLPDYARYPACKVEFVKTTTLPPWDSLFVDKLNLTETERDAYYDMLDNLHEETVGPLHQVGGHPATIQGEMQLECQLVSHGIYCGDVEGYADPRRAELESGAEDWCLLLQIDSDDNSEMMWGDVGMIYFWIQRQALEQQQFEKAWMILQCC